MTAKIVSMRRNDERVNGAIGGERDASEMREAIHALDAKIEKIAAAVEKLSDAQRAQSELFDELMPIGALAVKKLAATIDEVRHEAEALKPAGVMGLWRATSDEDVRRGLAIAVETVRRLGAAARPDGARVGANAGALTKAVGVKRAAAAKGSVEAGAAAVAEPSKRDKLAAALAPSRMRTQTTVGLGDAQMAKTVPQGQPVTRGTVTRDGVTHATAPKVGAAGAAGAGAAGLAGIRLNEEGFLADPREWSPSVAIRIAEALGVGELTEAHWKLVNYAREQFIESGASPNVRKITVGTGVSTREMYGLFPVKPGITVAKIAGIPKPVGCV